MSAGDLVVGHLPAVTLPELEARAARLTRLDRKYLLTHAEAQALTAGLPAGVAALEIGGRRTFGYRSVYLDTPDGDAYAATAHRRRRRFKVRTRTYLDSGACWLEVKTRGPRGTSVKTRHPRPGGAPDWLTGEERDLVAATLREAGIDPAPVDRLEPVLLTRYRRTTLYLPGDGARATLDTDLEWQDAVGRWRGAPGLAVVETKTGATPSTVDRLLWAAGHRPVRISKFATGLALLHPDLPSNRWHRTLRRLDATATR